MKTWLKLGAGIGLGMIAGLVRAGEVQRGDRAAEVKALLGPPQGEITTGDRMMYYYERGRVELVKGRVVEAQLISQEEADHRRLQREQAARAARVEEAKRRAQRQAEGQSLRQQKIADPGFQAASPRHRLEFWQQFMRD